MQILDIYNMILFNQYLVGNLTFRFTLLSFH